MPHWVRPTVRSSEGSAKFAHTFSVDPRVIRYCFAEESSLPPLSSVPPVDHPLNFPMPSSAVSVIVVPP